MKTEMTPSQAIVLYRTIEALSNQFDLENRAGAPPEVCREMWAVVFPDGNIVTGSDLQTEADAWRIALVWPGPAEIAEAMKRGAFAVKASLHYQPPRTSSNAKLMDAASKPPHSTGVTD